MLSFVINIELFTFSSCQMRTTTPGGNEMFKIQRGKGQQQTLARFRALSCKRMAVQQALMVHGLCGQLPPQHVWNIDASTMIIEDSGKGGQNYRVVSCHEDDTWEADRFPPFRIYSRARCAFNSISCWARKQ
jgi:hypothetical protein